MPQDIAFSLQDYCELVDTTGRIIRADKAGAINSAQSPILHRLKKDRGSSCLINKTFN
jgi:hypothetical protein